MDLTSSALYPGLSDFAVALALAAILGFGAQFVRLPRSSRRSPISA